MRRWYKTLPWSGSRQRLNGSFEAGLPFRYGFALELRPRGPVGVRWAREKKKGLTRTDWFETTPGEWRLPIPVEHCWHQDQGHWKARAGNLALARSTPGYVLIVDRDCMPTRRWVEDHARLAELGCYVQARRHQSVESSVPDDLARRAGLLTLALTGGLRNAKHALRLPRPLVYCYRDLHRTSSANFAAWRKDLVAVNSWNEAFRSWGSEDWELAAQGP